MDENWKPSKKERVRWGLERLDRFTKILIIVFVVLLVSACGTYLLGRDRVEKLALGLPWVERGEWSIGIYVSDNGPFELHEPANIHNPVLTASDVTDYGSVDGVADPFVLITENGSWDMFFETMNYQKSPDAVISHATSSDNGITWDYNQVVLRENYHISFPYVFEWNGGYWMSVEAESDHVEGVHLYKADNYPTSWVDLGTIINPGYNPDDQTFFRWENRWWCFIGHGDAEELDIYYSHVLTENYLPHSQNPVKTDQYYRPRGRPIVGENHIMYFFPQVTAFKITELTADTYSDRKSGTIIEGDGSGWNSKKMHHIDLHETSEGEWIAAVDGHSQSSLAWRVIVGIGKNSFFLGGFSLLLIIIILFLLVWRRRR